MKTLQWTSLFLTIVLITGIAEANYNTPSDSGKQNYLMAIKSDNQGLILSSMMNIIKLKALAPSTELGKIQTIINEFSTEHSDVTIRYCARLATEVFADPQWFANVKVVSTNDIIEFYRIVAKRLDEKVFVCK